MADFELEIEQNVRGAILADVDSFSDPAGARLDKVHAITRYQGRIRRRGRQFEAMLMNLFRTSIKHIGHDRKCISGKEMTIRIWKCRYYVELGDSVLSAFAQRLTN